MVKVLSKDSENWGGKGKGNNNCLSMPQRESRSYDSVVASPEGEALNAGIFRRESRCLVRYTGKYMSLMTAP